MITQEHTFGNLGVKQHGCNAVKAGLLRLDAITNKICHFILHLANPLYRPLHSTSHFAFRSCHAGQIEQVA